MEFELKDFVIMGLSGVISMIVVAVYMKMANKK